MRRIGGVLKKVGIALLALLVAGAIYEQVGLARDAKLSPPASDLVTANGRAFHVSCIGSGPRTFVLDAGLGSWSFQWWRVQPLLAQAGRACAFDRAGLGWSDAAGGPHDGFSAAEDLAAAVTAAKIQTPFIYVGHSLGANFAQIYFGRHPQDIAALILLEPGQPKDLREDFHGTRTEAMAAPECGLGCFGAKVAGYVGLTRVAAFAAGKSLPPDQRAQYRAGIGRPSTSVTAMASLGALPKTAYETEDIRSFGDTPVLVFASSALRKPEGKETVEDVARWLTGYRAYLATRVAASSRGVGPVVIPGSNHSSLVLAPGPAEAVAREIISFSGKLPE